MGALGVRVGTWNLGSLGGNVRDVCEGIRKMLVHVVCGR